MDSRIMVKTEASKYALPTVSGDHIEEDRLNAQHAGHKAAQGGKNYLAPILEALPNQGRGKMVLDVGTGTGIWPNEMAYEFPEAKIVGVDLAPVPTPSHLANAVEFVQGDVLSGLPFPDGSFDIVHERFLVTGITDWSIVLSESARLLRPGGLFVSVETGAPWLIVGARPEDYHQVAPGFAQWNQTLCMACTRAPYDAKAAESTIPKLMRANAAFCNITTERSILPLWPWSEEKHLKESGTHMLRDVRQFPRTFERLFTTFGNVTTEEYEKLSAGFQLDLGRPGADTAIPVWHTWAWKSRRE